MTMTDPIADMLTRLRNANSAYHDSVAMPFSKLSAMVASYELIDAPLFIALGHFVQPTVIATRPQARPERT